MPFISVDLKSVISAGAQFCSQGFFEVWSGEFLRILVCHLWSMLCNPVHVWESIVHTAEKKYKFCHYLLTSMLIQTWMLLFFLWNPFQVLFQQFSDYSCQAPQRTEKHFKRTIKFHMTCTLQHMLNLFELGVRIQLIFCFVVSENPCPLLQISETFLTISPYSVHNNISEIHFWVNYSFNNELVLAGG